MSKRSSWVPVAVGAVVIFLWIAGGVLPIHFIGGWDKRGQFGDLFGATNALFSGLAFAGLIYAILLQREELSLQRRELELTRDQLQRAADAQEKSQASLRAQVEMQLLSVRLQGLAALLVHRSTTQDLTDKSPYRDFALKTAGRDAETYARQVEKLLGELRTLMK